MIRVLVADRPGAAGPIPAPAPSSVVTPDEAFRYCERIASSHAENFPVASRFVPEELRKYVWAIYAFARAADDFADEPQYEGRRAAALDDWEDQLERCYHGEAEHPIFVALRETIEHRDIPISPLRDLITAFRMDVNFSGHPTFSSLERYCAHCAAPVGRLLLYIFDYRDPAQHRFVDDLATGLQLTKVLQDVRSDALKGRVYLPLEDLTHFGVSESELVAGRATREFRDLMRFQVARARAYLERGRPLVERVGRDLSFELALIWHGGASVLDKIAAVDHDVLRHRPTLDGLDRMRVVMKSAAHRRAISRR